MKYQQTCLCGNQSNYTKVFSGKHKKSVSQQKKKTKFIYSIIKCNECNLVQTYPRPYEDSLNSDYYQDRNDVDDRVKRKDTFKIYADFILDKIKSFKSQGTFIDIGCSIGVLAHEAQKAGFDANGIEINQYAIKKAKELFNLDLRNEDLFKSTLPKQSIDVMTLIHVIEHIEKPVEFLSQIKTFLKPDGILYISCPNFGGYMVNYKKTKWGGLDPMRHLWQYTPETLGAIIEQSGLKVKKFILNHNMDHYAYELKRDNFFIRKIKQYLLRRSIERNQGDHLICIVGQ